MPAAIVMRRLRTPYAARPARILNYLAPEADPEGNGEVYQSSPEVGADRGARDHGGGISGRCRGHALARRLSSLVGLRPGLGRRIPRIQVRPEPRLESARGCF